MTNIIEAKDFKILKNLGEGTFGTVYHCVNDHYKKECCIKVIEVREKRQYNHLKLIKREIHILLHLKHPRILQLYDFFRTENLVFIVTEYVENGTLKQLMDHYDKKGSKFNQEEILNYFCDILLGLEYLLIKNVVHGDLKSENILISGNGRIKIADFGVSKSLSEPIDLDALCHSTPLYTAPEALFDNTKFTFSSDIWSLGCIFYELCMLRHPFHRVENIEELYDLASRSIYQTIDFKRKNYDVEMVTLSNVMLEPTVEKRATIEKIIKQPFLTILYYEKYFSYDDI